MIWKEYSELVGKHSILSPSTSSTWKNIKSKEDLERRIKAKYATEIGTILHSYASTRIDNSLKMNSREKNAVVAKLLECGIPRNMIDINKYMDNLVTYVNDAIGFRMRTEQPLRYSKRIFGTADAISFKKNVLRIHDLKTGESPVHMEQLLSYAALFCFDYNVNPLDISTELRFYQSNNVIVYEPEPDEIVSQQQTIKMLSEMADEIYMEG